MARVGEYYDGGRRGGREEVYGKERKKTASEMHPLRKRMVVGVGGVEVDRWW